MPPTLTLKSTSEVTERLSALGWAVDPSKPNYALADVLRRFQASVPTLLIDGNYGPRTESSLFSKYAPTCKPGQLYPDFGSYLTYAESVKSQTAIRRGIDNTPPPPHYRNMLSVYEQVYQPLCIHFGRKLPVTSFYRSAALNRVVKGSATSAHLSGLAVDIDCDGLNYPTNRELFRYCVANIKADQCINEYDFSWVHIGLNRYGQPNRGQVLNID